MIGGKIPLEGIPVDMPSATKEKMVAAFKDLMAVTPWNESPSDRHIRLAAVFKNIVQPYAEYRNELDHHYVKYRDELESAKLRFMADLEAGRAAKE